MERAQQPPRRRVTRRAPATLLAALAVLAAAEAALQVEAVRERLPMPIPYYSDNVEPRRRALARMGDREGGVDLLLVGSSVVRTNLSPLVFDAALEAAAGSDLRSFNGGLSGLVPDQARLYLERFFLPRCRPRLVLQGIRLEELEHTEEATAFRRLERARLERAWLDGGVWGGLRSAAIERIQLVRYRGVMTDFLRRERWPPGKNLGYAIDRRGFAVAEGRLQRAAPGPLRPYGETAADPPAVGLASLRRAHRLCRQRGIVFAVVNLPEHGDRFATAWGPARYRRYLETLHALGRASGFAVLDPTAGDPFAFRDDADFADSHHMTRDGAYRLSRALARELAAALPEVVGR